VTTRATARHRASVRPTTPMSVLSSAVTDHVGSLGRGGVVLAMSSGLVATMGLPAQAVSHSSVAEAAPATAPIAVQPAVAFQSGLIAAPAVVQAGTAPLTAPVAATVSFASNDFTAVPQKVVVPASRRSARPSSVRGDMSSSFGSARGSSILAIAARYLNVPYRYGGDTPLGWDCSGATSYIYGQVGVHIPRTANQQMLASKRIPRSEARPGDLLFMVSGGMAFHTAIYAGNNMMYDAGRTGRRFSKREIFTSSVVFGRV
jgi:cell wall-associated NlpC family hydrolase